MSHRRCRRYSKLKTLQHHLPTTTIFSCLFLVVMQSTFADGLSLTQCIRDYLSVWDRLSCPNNDLIHIDHAFLAVANDATPTQFCQQPISDANAHCVISDVTADVIAACATFTKCRMSASKFDRFSRSNCTGQSHWLNSSQPAYLHVQYDCLPVTHRGVNELNIVFMTSLIDYTDVTGVLYLATSGYPLSWSRRSNRCRIRAPVDSVVTWSLLDVRGRTINMAAACAYRLLLMSGSQRMERCASLRWLPDTVSMEASAGRPIVIAFEPVMQELSQGMLWIHVNVTPSGVDQRTEHSDVNINIMCGAELHIDPLSLRSALSTVSPMARQSTTRGDQTHTTWLIIGLSFGVALLLLTAVVVAVIFVLIRYRRRLTHKRAWSGGDVIYAYEQNVNSESTNDSASDKPRDQPRD